MRILIPVLHYCPVIGGLETWTKNIAERLSDKVEMFVVTGRVKDSPKKETLSGVDIFRTSFYSLQDLSYSSLIYILTALPFIFFKSFFLIKEKEINLCHCQGFLSSFLGYLFLKLRGIPYIVTVQRLETRKDFLRKLVYRNAKICLVSSFAVKEYFKEIGVKDIRIVPNGIDFKEFIGLDRESLRRKIGLKNEFTVITVGRLERRKGFQYLIKAFNILENRVKDKIKLIIIGGGDLKKELEDLAENLSLKEKIDFRGQISPKDVPGYLGACDCFVLSSLEEGFGIVILEAMASGVPVIGTRIGGILDIIEDGENGILVESKNPEQIAEAVFKIYSQSEFAKNLVLNAKNNLEKYDWDSIIEKVYTIYQELLWKKSLP